MKKCVLGVFLILITAIIGMSFSVDGMADSYDVKWTTLKVAPKKMRGTWYHYDKGTGFSKVVIKRHQVSFNSSYGKKKAKMFTIPKLVIHKGTWKNKQTNHKHVNYAFEGENGYTYGAVFYNYTVKIKGKKRHVLVRPSMNIKEKPMVYTNFKVKHTYSAPISSQD